MIYILAHNYVAEEKRDLFLEYAKKMVEETRKEQGNISYHLVEHIHEANHFTFVEVWKDQQSIDTHNESSHFTTLVPLMHACCAKERTGFIT